MITENEFKETEIGLIPCNWAIRRISEIASIKYGKQKPKNGERYPVIGSSGIYAYSDVPLIDFETLIVGRKGNAGTVQLMLGPCWPADTTFYLEWSSKDVNVQFLYYFMSAHRLSGEHAKTTLPSVQRQDLENYLFPVPSIQEQSKIVILMRILQQAIAQQEKIIEKTKELKRSLMRRLFTYGLRGEELKETEIGLMPESWEVKLLEAVAPFQGGFAFKSNDYEKSGVRLLKIANVSFGKVLWEDVSFLPEEYLIQHSEYVLNENDIVMAMTRPIIAGGIKVAKITVTDSPCLLNQRVGRFKANPMLYTDYLYQFLFTNKFVNYILYGAGGSQQPNISANKIGQCFIPCPSLDEQKEIANIFLNLDNKINQAEDKQINLRELFKSMLQLLMAGQVRVKDIDFGEACE